jgi:serine/threonine protein kinase
MTTPPIDSMMSWPRFFFKEGDYQLERGLYDKEVFRKCLQHLMHPEDNAHGTAVSRSGDRFHPFMALDHGATFKEWLMLKRLASSVLAMAGEVLDLLAALHASGHVHRDLKPDNLLVVFHDQTWRLLDFCIVLTTGGFPSYMQDMNCRVDNGLGSGQAV